MAEESSEQTPAKRSRRFTPTRIGLGAVGIAIVVATFVFVLPRVADYRDVWDVVKEISWPWILALVAATLVNISTFAPPWMVALPGLRFWPALMMTQASTALSIVAPGGAAVGIAGSYGILRSWGFEGNAIGRAVTLTSLWNQLANLAYPIVAVFALAVTGEQTGVLATAAFVGAAVFGIAVAALVLVLYSDRLAEDIGDAAARGASWTLVKLRRKPVSWNGRSFERFRRETVELLVRRWHLLTLTTFLGSMTVFVVLLISLRALQVPASEVTVVDAFAAWSLARLLGSIPITPGGIGVVELSLTGTLVGFGGNNTGVVAAVLVYRFLTMVPTLLLGMVATATLKRHSESVPGRERDESVPAEP
jgi:putative heme transporter